MNRESLAVVGPTASGKTAVAVSLARRRGDVELVSVDSMAVYRGLDIGTAKPTGAERAGLAWHGIDLVDPAEEFSVAQFQEVVQAARAQIVARGHRVVFVGGTGLYYRAAVDGLELAGRYGEIAGKLEERARDLEGQRSLYARLEELDPLAASKMNPTNVRRIVRALEVTLGTGRPFSTFGSGMTDYQKTDTKIVGLSIERDELYRRIAQRLELQLAAGFVDEVEALLKRGTPLSRTAAQALGYRELIDYLRERSTYEEACALIVARTRRFARRQEAWFRRDPRVIWIDALLPDLVDRVDQLVSGRG